MKKKNPKNNSVKKAAPADSKMNESRRDFLKKMTKWSKIVFASAIGIEFAASEGCRDIPYLESYFDYANYGDYADYSEYYDYSEYSDYNDYSDYADYGDYSDYSNYGNYGDYANYSDYSDSS